MSAAKLFVASAEKLDLSPETQVIVFAEFLVSRFPGTERDGTTQKMKELLECLGMTPEVMLEVLGAVVERYAATEDFKAYLVDLEQRWKAVEGIEEVEEEPAPAIA